MTANTHAQDAPSRAERPGWWDQETPANWQTGSGLIWVFRILGMGVFIARDLDEALDHLTQHCPEDAAVIEQVLLDHCPRTAGEVVNLPLTSSVQVEAHALAAYLRDQVRRLDTLAAQVSGWEAALGRTLATVGQAAVLAGEGEQLFMERRAPSISAPFGSGGQPTRWALGVDPQRMKRLSASTTNYELTQFCSDFIAAGKAERDRQNAEREAAGEEKRQERELQKAVTAGVHRFMGYLGAPDFEPQDEAEHEALRLHRVWRSEAPGAEQDEARRELEEWLSSQVLHLAPPRQDTGNDESQVASAVHVPPALSAEGRELAAQVADAVLALDPDASGYLVVRKGDGEVTATGRMTTRLPDLNAAIAGALAALVPEDARSLVCNEAVRGLHVVVEEDTGRQVASRSLAERRLDEVGVIYQGELSTSLIRPSGIYKQLNWQTRDKVADCARVLGFLTPLVLDRTLTVVDGDLRLSVALELAASGYERMNRVPVVVLDDAGVRAHFLRLTLNRSSEFQRWDHATVNAYVDEHPQVQPLLEPLGFFGERLLPETFFGNSIQDYAIDPYNEAQAQYRQELGLAEWARIRRREVAQGRAKPKRWVTPPTTSLFDLRPDPDDFLPTFEARAEMDAFVQVQEEMGARVTETYDAATEAHNGGRQRQNTRRTTKEATQARREAAEGGT